MIFDKIWGITPLWLKKPTIYKVFKAVIGYWDYLYERMMYVRLMSIAATSEDKWLELIGRGKGLPKLAGENPEQYKGRVINAKQFWRDIGSVRGLLKWMEAAGYPATLNEYVFEADKLVDSERLLGQDTLDGTGDLSLSQEIDDDKLYRWAEFEVVVDIGSAEFTRDVQKYLINLVNLARRASKVFALFYFREELNFQNISSIWSFYQLQTFHHTQGGFGEYLDGQGTICDDPLEPYTWGESSALITLPLEFDFKGPELEYLSDGGPIYFLDGSGALGAGGLLDGSDTLDGTGDLSYPGLHPGYLYTLNEPDSPLVDESSVPSIKTYIYHGEGI